MPMKETGIPIGIQHIFPHDVLRQFGCYFFTILKWVELTTGRTFTNDSIIATYNEAVKNGLIGKNCFITNVVKLANFILGENRYRDDKRVDVTQTTKKPTEDIYIIRLVKPNGATHFTLCFKGQIWDSLDPNRAAAKQYSISQYRYFIT